MRSLALRSRKRPALPALFLRHFQQLRHQKSVYNKEQDFSILIRQAAERLRKFKLEDHELKERQARSRFADHAQTNDALSQLLNNLRHLAPARDRPFQTNRRLGATRQAGDLERRGASSGGARGRMAPEDFGIASASSARRQEAKAAVKAAPKKVEEKTVQISIRQSLAYLSQRMGVPVAALQEKIEELGMPRKAAQDVIPADVAELLVTEYNMKPVRATAKATLKHGFTEEELASAPPRPPVICVMGHVDHGKTTLLDALRSSSMAAREAGGITQSMGAFSVQLSETEQATILDTPGHAAFRAMRVRGATSGFTDIIVLVVSVNDGVQPQTIEAIRLAQANDIRVIVAINKCDLPNANPQRIRDQLGKQGLFLEGMGGDVQNVEISALRRLGLDDLKAAISAEAEMLELRAPNTGLVDASIIESRIDRAHGCLVTVIVRRGRLAVGDVVVSGNQFAKVRAMLDDSGERVQAALPGQAVSVMGFESLDGISHTEFVGSQTEDEARRVVEARLQEAEEKALEAEIEAKESEGPRESKPRYDRDLARSPTKGTEEEKAAILAARNFWRQRHQRNVYVPPTEEERKAMEAEEAKTLRLLVKSDVLGSLEVMLDYLKQLPDEDVKVQIVKSGVGEITEGDIETADRFDAHMVLGFNVRVGHQAQRLAAHKQIKLEAKRVIYELFDAIKAELTARMPKQYRVVNFGAADVKQVFDLRGKGKSTRRVAGCIVRAGELLADKQFRVLRDDEVLWEGGAQELKHFKETVKKVEKSQECGLLLDGFYDLEEGDRIECFNVEETAREFDDSAARQFKRVAAVRPDLAIAEIDFAGGNAQY